MVGDVVFASFPVADQSCFKVRPCLVVAPADERGDLEVLKITSKGIDQPGRVPIRPEDWVKGGLEISSAVVPSDLAKTNVALVVRYVGQLNPAKVQAILKQRIKRSVETFSRVAHAAQRPGEDPKRTAFRPGVDVVPYAGRVFDEKEVEAAVAATLDFWLTLGKEGEAFEAELASYLGVRRSILTNSGSSANLLALSALTSHKLPEERRIRRGDEVITCAAGFPTTVAPILQNGAVPVFLDNDPITGNADLSRLEDAYVPGKTKAVMMAHALGNPFDLGTILAFCRKYNLWLIEDNCDALGSTYSMPEPLARSLGLDHLLRIAEKGDHPLICLEPNGSAGETRMLTAPTGTWGDLSTQSFYPPHHLTMGEGGAVNIVKDMKLKVLVESFRDWGRDCWCASGMDNTCRKRFGWQLGELPEGYDHKYIYSHLGYNLKPLDPQAAIGRVQLQKLPAFTKARRSNWEALRRGLAGLEDYFQFSLPTHATAWCPPGSASPENKRESGNGVEDGSCFLWEASSGAAPYPSMGEPWAKRSRPSWFGFMMLVRPDAPFSRTDFVQYLDACKIGNRMLFGGNLVRQPAFVQLRRDNPQAFRILGPDPASSSALPGADRIMNEAVFIGVYPGLTRKQIDYMIDSIRRFVRERAATAAAVRGEELGVDSDR